MVSVVLASERNARYIQVTHNRNGIQSTVITLVLGMGAVRYEKKNVLLLPPKFLEDPLSICSGSAPVQLS